MVAQLVEVEVLLDAGAEGVDDRLDLLVGEDLVQAGLLDVEDLAADREDGLRLRVAPAARRTARGVTLDDEHLAVSGVAGLAVDELAGQTAAAKETLAVTGHVAGLAGGDPGECGRLRLADDVLALGGVAFEPVSQPVVEDLLHERLGLGVAEFGLGLTLELWFGELDGDDGGQALADVVTGDPVLLLLHQTPGLAPAVHGVGQGRAETLLVGAALVGVDGVGEGVHRAGVGGVPLHRDLQAHALGFVVGFDVDDAGVDGILRLRQVAHVVDQAVLETERVVALLLLGILTLPVDGAQVGEGDPEPLVEEGHLAEPRGEGLVVEDGGLEDFRAGVEGDGGAGVLGFLQFLEVVAGHTQVEGLHVAVAVAGDLDGELLRQRIDHRRPDAVEAAGDLVAAVAELSAGVEDGEHQGHRRDFLHGVLLDGNAAAVVGDAHAAVVEQGDIDLVAVTGQGLVDGVVHDFVDQVVQAAFTGGPDVHAGAFANRLQALQYRNLLRVVGRVGVCAAGLPGLVLGFQLAGLLFCHAVLPFHETAAG